MMKRFSNVSWNNRVLGHLGTSGTGLDMLTGRMGNKEEAEVLFQ